MDQVAVDIGGTFTDLVARDSEGRLVVSKVLTTPEDQAEGLMAAVGRAQVDLHSTALFLHGSTIAINTVIAREGAKTALITTRGFRDVYEIGRSNRPDAYNLFFQRPVPLVPRRLRFEVNERITARGQVHTPLDREEAAALARRLREAGVDAIAICLLHSYANPAHEQALAEIIGSIHPAAYLAVSHRILMEYREYERTATTAVNAYVGPAVSRYLASVGAGLESRGFSGQFLVMQSSGGVMPLEAAIRTPVRMMESGPVAGVMGAARVAQSLGYPRAIAFDMGGTTAKTSLTSDGNAEITGHYFIGGYATGQPVMLPVVDIVEVGSGGGSIAWVDSAGGLKVGPRSAGAVPGPACYGLGGTQPTVTDANLVLGRLGAKSFLGGEMTLDAEKARAAIRTAVAEPLGLGIEPAAIAILRIANAHMALALRSVTIERGQDPRDFAIVGFGGAGPLHTSELAHELGVPVVIVPRLPGQFSACGMLTCDLRSDVVQTHLRDFAAIDTDETAGALQTLADRSTSAVRGPQAQHHPLRVSCGLDLRYVGQEFTITVPLPGTGFTTRDRDTAAARFHELHESLYGHAAPTERIELAALRVTVQRLAAPAAPEPRVSSAAVEPGGATPYDHRQVWAGERFGITNTAVYRRADLPAGAAIEGPAVIEEPASTTLLLPQDQLRVASGGELIISIAQSNHFVP